MPFIIVILSITICTLLFWSAYKITEDDHFLIGLTLFILGVLMIAVVICTTINACTYGEYLVNTEAYNAQAIEERIAYEAMFNEIKRLIKQDVTASSTYLKIYDNIIDFNKQVNRANKWGGTLGEGIFCDPRYKGLEAIPLN